MDQAETPRRRSSAAPVPGCEPDMPNALDEQLRAAVLVSLLDIYPAPLTLAELILELADDAGSFAERDDIERAVRDLVSAGLLHRYPTHRAHTVFFFATRSAVRFDALPMT